MILTYCVIIAILYFVWTLSYYYDFLNYDNVYEPGYVIPAITILCVFWPLTLISLIAFVTVLFWAKPK